MSDSTEHSIQFDTGATDTETLPTPLTAPTVTPTAPAKGIKQVKQEDKPAEAYNEIQKNTKSPYGTTTEPSQVNNGENASGKYNGSRDDERAPDGMFMEIHVTSPEVTRDKDAHVSYLVTTETSLESFKNKVASVRRRYQDFVLLYELLREYPAAALPPLPGKHRLEYITGDRFSDEFIERRRISLERFLQRLARHPVLQRTEHLRCFLEASDFSIVCATLPKHGTTLDSLGDSLLNVFTKLREKDEKYVQMRDTVNKIEESLMAAENMHHRIVKRRIELEQDFMDLSASFVKLGQIETFIMGGLDGMASVLVDYVGGIKMLNDHESSNFLTQLHEIIQYSQSIKDVLKLRDQKQLDYEELAAYLQSATHERERLQRGTIGLTGYLREKIAKGERVREERMEKLGVKIEELKEAVQTSSEESRVFSETVEHEWTNFQKIHQLEMKELLAGHAQANADFYRESMKVWESIIPILEKIK
ncbi:uncharacterized protein VTP21DRAFT_7105 [Calcarisporiella thermophila]|uniref:uncharacterized protein n=1 Tax=Calcarisporiella thermophila TaxID=911321 RepID=UPI0037446C2E